MSPGLRPFLVVLVFGQGFALWWLSGNYRAGTGVAAESGKGEPLTVWSAEASHGKFWTSHDKNTIERRGTGISGKGKSLTVCLDGPGWRGCGLNWKNWYPAEACDDVSGYRSLVFHVRQLTNDPEADLTVHLQDNVRRLEKGPVSNPIELVKGGVVPCLDGEWRKVVISLERLAQDRELDLTRVWGIDFSDGSGRPLAFQIDQIAFSDEHPPELPSTIALPKFPAGEPYSARATVELGSAGYRISEGIYGTCDLHREKLQAYAITSVRWGGNRSSRYNWKINADNAGKDWFYKNGGQRVSSPADGGWARYLREKNAIGVGGYMTVPMLGFVSKDHESYAFSVRKYGPQRKSEAGQPDVGDGILPTGVFLTGNDWRDTSISIGPDFIAEGVRFSAGHAGSRPRTWVLDNEPMLWHETHRDVRTQPMSYDELWERTLRYAEAIRVADPGAKIAGFCSWGWTDLFYSAADEGGDGYRTRADHRAHGSMPLAEWFIQKCGEYRQKHGKPLVDVFDLHWYPQAEIDGRSPYLGQGADPRLNELRLRTTRDLWDPNYVQESWIQKANGKPTMILRRVREWIAKHNPGMEVCLGEYNFGGSDNITGALAQVEVFGTLARERIEQAYIWTHPEGTQELAWKLFRNYDGLGSKFGDVHVPTGVESENLSVFAARRTSDGALTIIVVNRSLGSPCDLKLTLPELKGSLRAWRFDQNHGHAVVACPRESRVIDGGIQMNLPAASATMLVVK